MLFKFFFIFNIYIFDIRVLYVYIKIIDKFIGFCRGFKINFDGERLNIL